MLAWLARHPRWMFHFTPTSASWLNAVENFFSKMTRQRIRRGVFRSIVDLQTAINAYLTEHNASPKPFVWTQSAEAILAKLVDIVGLYVDPPAHAVVLSLDEKSQIQALDRTQPGLPIKPGRCQTMTHDYKRHGTTTLFAALSVLDGRVIGRCMQRHRHLEFIRFLNAVERQVPPAS